MKMEPEDLLPRALAVILFIGLVTLSLLLIGQSRAADAPRDRAAFNDADTRRIQAVVQALDGQRVMTPEPVTIIRPGPASAGIPPELQRFLPAPGRAPLPDRNTNIDPRSLQWALRTPPMPEGAVMRYTPRELEILMRTPPAVGGVRP